MEYVTLRLVVYILRDQGQFFFLLIKNRGRKENKVRVLTLYQVALTFLYWKTQQISRLKPDEFRMNFDPSQSYSTRQIYSSKKSLYYLCTNTFYFFFYFLILSPPFYSFLLFSTLFYFFLLSFLLLSTLFCSLFFLFFVLMSFSVFFLLKEKKFLFPSVYVLLE